MSWFTRLTLVSGLTAVILASCAGLAFAQAESATPLNTIRHVVSKPCTAQGYIQLLQAVMAMGEQAGIPQDQLQICPAYDYGDPEKPQAGFCTPQQTMTGNYWPHTLYLMVPPDRFVNVVKALTVGEPPKALFVYFTSSSAVSGHLTAAVAVSPVHYNVPTTSLPGMPPAPAPPPAQMTVLVSTVPRTMTGELRAFLDTHLLGSPGP